MWTLAQEILLTSSLPCQVCGTMGPLVRGEPGAAHDHARGHIRHRPPDRAVQSWHTGAAPGATRLDFQVPRGTACCFAACACQDVEPLAAPASSIAVELSLVDDVVLGAVAHARIVMQ